MCILLIHLVYVSSESIVTLSLLQLPYNAPNTQIEEYLSIASKNQTDIAIFPSSFLNGSCLSNKELILNWCLKYNLSISISCQASNNNIEGIIMDKSCNIILNYTKPERNGQDPNIQSSLLKLSNNLSIRVGIMLDDDILYPEIARSLMLQGTHLICYMTKGNLTKIIHDTLLYSRGAENLLIIARVNRAISNYNISINDNGRSAVASNLSNHIHENQQFIISPVNNQVQIITTSFDLDYITNARAINHMGDNLRRPFHYKPLCNITNSYNYSNEIKNELYTANGSDILVRIAALQLFAGNSVEDNIKIGDKFVREANLNGADIAFMPEMYSVGYNQLFPEYIHGNITSMDAVYKWLDLAQTKNDKFVSYFRNLSIELSIGIGVTYLELKTNNNNNISPYNSIILFDKNGNELYTYSKVHTVGDAYCEALTNGGWMFYMNEFDLKDNNRGKINIGSEICFDQDNPESARILSNKLNVEIILHSNACVYTSGLHWRLKSRAIENKCGIIMANYAYPTMNGNSVAYDSYGNTLAIANKTQQVVMVTFNITDIRINRLNLKPIHHIKRLCDFQRQTDFTMNNKYHRVSGCTV